MIDDSEYLERIVAGIHSVTTEGAEVTWNEVINDRQFDVVVRFQLGTLRYLVLVEVKNRTRKTAIADMDAFVTKASDQNANKAVFVTAAGFQDGAITVAKRHGIDLFTVKFDTESQPTIPQNAAFITFRKTGAPTDTVPVLKFGEPTLVRIFARATLVYADGRTVQMPDEQSQMTYYCRMSKLADGRALNEVMSGAELEQVELGSSRTEVIKINPPQHLQPPDTLFFPAGTLSAIEVEVKGRLGRPIEGNVSIDPSLFVLPVIYTNVITGEANRFALDQLPLGVERVCAGQFYFMYHPLMYYYCESVEDNNVTWILVESFQSGRRFSTTFKQEIKYSNQYIPVSDRNTLSRLELRLKEYRANPKAHSGSPLPRGRADK